MINIEKEKEFLDSLVSNYVTTNTSSQTRLMRDLIIRTLKPFINGGHVLELGCEIGYMSEQLSKLVDTIDIVDGSKEFLEKTKERNLVNARYFNFLFENFVSDIKYDYVFASHVLEHMLDVKKVLSMVKNVLKPNGYFFVIVPNARVISRQLARQMGIIKSLYDLTPNDYRGGHKIVYDRILLNKELEGSGFETVIQGGIFFKPFADFQMDKLIDSGIVGKEQVEGLYKLGMEYPDMCADIYSIVRPIN